MSRVVVVGGGAAGMMAAIWAAREGGEVSLYEKNEKLGKKLFITGKGRCNLTNACETEELFASIVSNEKFLYSALYSFGNDMTMQFFEQLGLPIKVERGNRVFPVSDHSSDVIRVLEQELKRLHVMVHLKTPVGRLLVSSDAETDDADGKRTADEEMQHINEKRTARTGKQRIYGIQTQSGEKVMADRVILATGGVSYPLTGSTGDGHRMAERTGHPVTGLYPALVPFQVKEEWCRRLQGLSLRNVRLTVRDGKKVLFQEFGEMLFTHYGVSGPLILSASSILTKRLQEKDTCFVMECDLKPALSPEQLDKRLLREFEENRKKHFKNVIPALFPAKLVPVMPELSGIDGELCAGEISAKQCRALGELIKHLPMTITGTRDFDEAIVTQGGVAVRAVNPSTMESKLVEGLFFAGELLDVDALTGGFNLQIAWSTAYLAGNAAAQ